MIICIAVILVLTLLFFYGLFTIKRLNEEIYGCEFLKYLYFSKNHEDFKDFISYFIDDDKFKFKEIRKLGKILLKFKNLDFEEIKSSHFNGICKKLMKNDK